MSAHEPALPGGLDRVSDALAQVERAMREQLASEGDAVAMMGDHVLGAGGKRLRPALLLLAAELCGYTGPRRIQIAAAVEQQSAAAGQISVSMEEIVQVSRSTDQSSSALQQAASELDALGRDLSDAMSWFVVKR